ncbi:uncharacterized protein B0H18DRAFT_873237 [Fomitopsis serialis]|uniref:uncharacterized protein n=1 Tax=Fomitopsis serialis TaxID=139415 RepID=UPI002007C662|nr:uncharacterized protein B0H18DRAFT_873237 [Neoantrodia serialis]KAH9930279.1 hypothetical protein B0H18DRAFT_873237 [Neoantrodia serialis]
MKSLRSPVANFNLRSPTAKSAPAAPLPPGAYKQRFRATVHRVMAMRRASTMMMSSGRIGAEPGIDPRRASANAHYGHIRQQCVIEIVDYSVTKCSVGRMGNRELVEMLGSQEASKREPWARVRWINVGGISWDVLSTLALRYDMHPLAIEDVIHQHGSNARSKADYYPQHLFLRILCHRLASEDDGDDSDDPGSIDPGKIPRSDSPEPMEESDYEPNGWGSKRPVSIKFPTKRFGSANGAAAEDVEMVRGRHTKAASVAPQPLKLQKTYTREQKALQKLKLENEDRVNVKISPVCIFLFRNGMHWPLHVPESNLDFMAPIRERLRQADTGLRKTADPSLLVQSLIDLIVDQALEVVEEYQGKILKIERDVLIRPKMKTVTALHMMQGDLNMHKRTLEPIKTLVYGLRRYDADRAAAIMASEGKVWEAVTRPAGFMSEKSKIYLADVHDHMEYILMSLDMFAGVSDNLVNYTCNMVSYQMNEGMRQLTLITIIFLPLTFLSGYFGMNFTPFPAVNNNTDFLFWKIAIPIMAVVMPLFLWSDLMRAVRNIGKHLIRRVSSTILLRGTLACADSLVGSSAIVFVSV